MVDAGSHDWSPRKGVTGLTQQSGKTTTCEAIVSRLPKGFKALVFRTKRGEQPFPGEHQVPPMRPGSGKSSTRTSPSGESRCRLRSPATARSWTVITGTGPPESWG